MIRFKKYFFLYVIIIFIISFNGAFLISILCVLLHELAHYIAALCFKFDGFDVEITPIGASLNLKNIDNATPIEDLVISISGPIFSISLGLLCYYLNYKFHEEYFEYLFLTNITIGLFNLTPAFPLDGGRILRDCLSLKILYRRANEILIYTSLVIGYLMILTFITLIFFKIYEFNLFCIGILILFSSFKEKKRFVYIILNDILKKKKIIKEKKYIECKVIAINYNEMLVKLLGLCDKNKYNVFEVIDDDLEYIGTLYENSLVKALKEKGNIKVKEILKYNRIKENYKED